MKVIAVFGDGSNQRALAHRIHQIIPLTHIAKIQLPNKKKRRIVRSLVSRTIAYSLHSSWVNLMKHYDALYKNWPVTSTSIYSSSNSNDLITLLSMEKPDLILISGTDLLTKATLDRLSTKIMNLHTGISPYIKGGPNCTNWALSLSEFDLIGNTIMWIDKGIDTGSIIATERTTLTGNENLNELHIKVMDHGHSLYCRSVKNFIEGKALKSVPQKSIDIGRIFYTRDWNSFHMIKAIYNYNFHFSRFKNRSNIQLINLE
jgi:folate-dependent phosphoribosylglycinamide formyltransferase PurN